MALQDFVSEHEASSITGMSAKTLQRFAEAGYLQVEVEGDGLRLYSKHQLLDVFGAAIADPQEKPPVAQAAPAEAAAPTVESASVAPADSVASPVEEVRASEDPQSASQQEPAATPAEPMEDVRTAAVTQDRSPLKDSDVSRLQAIVELQDKLLDQRERELSEVRAERDWLRARIERLEEKSNRDQLLLLSETQTIRKLIMISDAKKSSIRQFLEWCGIAKTTNGELMLGLSNVVTTERADAAAAEEKKAANS